MEEFDLFRLHAPEEDLTPRSWICAEGDNLQNKLDELINEILKERSEELLYVRLEPCEIKNLYNIAVSNAGSQSLLAKRLGVPRQCLYKWKESKRRIPDAVLLGLSKLAGAGYHDIEKYMLEKKLYRVGLTRDKIAKVLCKKLNTTLNFTERIVYKTRKEVSLIFIVELLKLWKDMLNKSEKELENKKTEIQGTFEFLKQNSGGGVYKVKAVKSIDLVLPRIAGALIADGHMSNYLNSISIIDEDRVNLETFSLWVRYTFGVRPNVRKCNKANAWWAKIDNKVIRRYMTVFFEFPIGKKRENYGMPSIVQKSGLNVQKAWAQGVMSFDGYALIRKQIGINIGSRRLRDDLFKIFEKDGLPVSKSRKPDKTGMWRTCSSGNSSSAHHQRWLDYFIEQSNKWFIIYEWVNGFHGRVTTEKEARIALMKYFSSKPNSKISLPSIFNIFLKAKSLTLKQILLILKKERIEIHESTLWKYLSCLRDMHIISKRRLSDNTNVYDLNEMLNDWRLPTRARFNLLQNP